LEDKRYTLEALGATIKRVVAFTSFLFLSFPLYTADMKSEKTPIVRLSVLKSGKVLPDGKESNLPEVKKALAKAKLHNGVVWYYRENGKDEPPPHAMEVIKLIIENNLPASMSSKPDFSDYIDDKGQSRPRK
jgi:hypothetical protein